MQQVSSYFPKRVERPEKVERAERVERPEPLQQPELLNEQSFISRLQNHPHIESIIKLTDLYLRCVLTVGELKASLQPYLDRHLLHYFI